MVIIYEMVKNGLFFVLFECICNKQCIVYNYALRQLVYTLHKIFCTYKIFIHILKYITAQALCVCMQAADKKSWYGTTAFIFVHIYIYYICILLFFC